MSQIVVELQETMGSDRTIAEAAWTSSMDLQKKKQRGPEDIKRVIKMLADNKHATPFESVIFRFWIKLPIAIDRQHMTHRIASHSGLSARYRTVPSEWLKVPQDIESIIDKIPLLDSQIIIEQYNRLCFDANEWYQELVKRLKLEENLTITNPEFKRLREFFRGVLPQHNMTERVTIFNLRSFANYQKLRNSPHAQLEIQYIAQEMLRLIQTSNICPIAIENLEKNNWNI